MRVDLLAGPVAFEQLKVREYHNRKIGFGYERGGAR